MLQSSSASAVFLFNMYRGKKEQELHVAFTRHGFDPVQLNLVGACSQYRTLAGAVNVK